MQVFMNADGRTGPKDMRSVDPRFSQLTQKEMGRADGRLPQGGGVIAGMVQDELWTKGKGGGEGLFVDVDDAPAEGSAEGPAEGKKAAPVAGEPLAEVEFAEKPVDPYGIQGTNVNLPV